MKRYFATILLAVLMFLATSSTAQNWQYLGASPYIHQNSSLTTYFYFGDMEINSAGEFFAGYWLYSGQLNFAKFSGGAWALLPSPATCPVNYVDIEVKGNNYYMAYSGVRGSNSYVFVRKFNGTTWDQLGDSLLLGNSGSGGWFEFLLDNNEVPTLLGPVSAPFADKQMVQFNGSSWSTVITLAGSNGTIFRENAGLFDATNKLLCASQGSTPSSYQVVNKIDAGVRTTVGDTLWGPSSASRVKLDATGTPYIIYNSPIITKVFAYKLSGNTWTFIADTAGTVGTMLSADVSGDGKVVFNTLQTVQNRSVYYYANNVRVNMDTIAVSGFAIGGIQDLVIAGSAEVNILELEVKPTAASDYAVMKHSLVTGINENIFGAKKQIYVYPNPANGIYTIEIKGGTGCSLNVYDLSGKLVYKQMVREGKNSIDLSSQPKGSYLFRITDEQGRSNEQLVIYQ
jgi:hypothetical protein